jgi:hypothetical protein
MNVLGVQTVSKVLSNLVWLTCFLEQTLYILPNKKDYLSYYGNDE